MKKNITVLVFFVLLIFSCSQKSELEKNFSKSIDPTQVLWYTHPADKWDNALPVGNGRLGAMVFGKFDEERIHFNEETYWSGGPYSTVVAGAYKALPEIQKLIFDGHYIRAHKLFGRTLMGMPMEQQKYQSFGDVILNFDSENEPEEYIQSLDLDRAIVTTTYIQNGVQFIREVFASPVDQVIVIRLTADTPGKDLLCCQS